LLATPTPLEAHENDASGVPVRDVDTVQAQALVFVDLKVGRVSDRHKPATRESAYLGQLRLAAAIARVGIYRPAPGAQGSLEAFNPPPQNYRPSFCLEVAEAQKAAELFDAGTTLH
jgi:hypothetical protein